MGSVGGSGISTVEAYDPATDTWTQKADMPTARGYLSTSVVNGKIYAIGGTPGSWGEMLSTVEEYDPVTDTWTTKDDMPTARCMLSTSVVDWKIYAIGGNVQYWPWTVTSKVEEYNPISPVVDFNDDGVVDCADMCVMVEHWHTDDPSCDIAPTPFGDGIVDVQDLIVLAEYLFTYPGAVAYWKLDETEGSIAHDSVGNNDVLLIGDPVWQPNGGMVDGAIELDGIDDYISTSFVLNPAEGKFSVFAWVKGGAPGQVIISQTNVENWLLADASEGRLMSELVFGRGATPLVSNLVITDGDWHRLGLTRDGSRKVLYVDDVEAASDTLTGYGSSVDGLYIGASKDLQPGSFWSGLIDDVRIYNRAVSP